LKPISYHSEAAREADGAAAYYYENNPSVTRDFLVVLGRIINEIQAAPHRWPYEGKTSAQRRQIKGFPYTIFYSNEPDKIFILAVAHTSRRPGYWKARISID
jgi:toxin ParE1/3/4